MTGQGVIVWLTGRPAAGKSTLASATAIELRKRGHDTAWLDSDEVRQSLLPHLGFSEADRDAFYARLAELAIEAAALHDVVLVSATAPRRRYRQAVRERAARFIEVFVDASESELVSRDPKGLYAAARAGTVTQLPGVSRPYEPPANPAVVCDTTTASVESSVVSIVRAVEQTMKPARTH